MQNHPAQSSIDHHQLSVLKGNRSTSRLSCLNHPRNPILSLISGSRVSARNNSVPNSASRTVLTWGRLLSVSRVAILPASSSRSDDRPDIHQQSYLERALAKSSASSRSVQIRRKSRAIRSDLLPNGRNKQAPLLRGFHLMTDLCSKPRTFIEAMGAAVSR